MATDSILQQIVSIVLAHKPVEKIVIFGSRARQDARRTSDIDIAVFARDWTDRDVNLVHDRLEENISTPLKFDVVSFYNISKESLRREILREGRTLYESGSHTDSVC